MINIVKYDAIFAYNMQFMHKKSQSLNSVSQISSDNERQN